MADKKPMSMFDRRRAGRGDNVKFTVGDAGNLTGPTAADRFTSLFNDRSSKLGGKDLKLGGKAAI
ncbi:hypothetical protein AB0A69_07520 [Streptomyces sp. NPDC045431]|uniref:hypothetical protein n=1 Tax=Streptomyces sp. NPDC045431 TaxID=3155613 RepID=UPI0033DC44DD